MGLLPGRHESAQQGGTYGRFSLLQRSARGTGGAAGMPRGSQLFDVQRGLRRKPLRGVEAAPPRHAGVLFRRNGLSGSDQDGRRPPCVQEPRYFLARERSAAGGENLRCGAGDSRRRRLQALAGALQQHAAGSCPYPQAHPRGFLEPSNAGPRALRPAAFRNPHRRNDRGRLAGHFVTAVGHPLPGETIFRLLGFRRRTIRSSRSGPPTGCPSPGA